MPEKNLYIKLETRIVGESIERWGPTEAPRQVIEEYQETGYRSKERAGKITFDLLSEDEKTMNKLQLAVRSVGRVFDLGYKYKHEVSFTPIDRDHI